jgi:hypothetical protein
VPARRSDPCHGILRGRRRSVTLALLSTRVGWESHTCQYAPSLSTKVRYGIAIYYLTADRPRSPIYYTTSVPFLVQKLAKKN